jgi:hypothetical protein
MTRRRRNHYDVTNRVRISHVADVRHAVKSILAGLYPKTSLAPLDRAFDTFARLYAGTLPGYAGCDTWYHDAQHGLDCTLAMARLLDGHERSDAATRPLGDRRAILGIIIALFHDAGYIRRTGDTAVHGAEFTLTHVRRSGEFLAGFLPTVGFADRVKLTHHLVHYTGYEIALDRIAVRGAQDRMLGFLLGTADILAQTADACYLEKCRDYLYREFEICGMAGSGIPGGPRVLYDSPRDLLQKTPDYNRHLWEDRLDGYFGGVHRYMAVHFGGGNPYVEQVRAHLRQVRQLTRSRRLGQLRKRPQVIGARAMRQQLPRLTRASAAATRPSQVAAA